MEYDLQLKLAEFKINGFTLFEDLVAPAKIDELCAAFLPLLEHVQARETEIGTAEVGDLRTGKGRMQLPSRYTLNWPLDPPFLDPEIYANPVVLGFLESYWETDDFQITCLHSNNPWPGSTLQPRRLDMRRGTFWVQDPRALHRGTPNTSDRPRPELVICYSLSWFRISRPVEIHRGSFEQLDARGKELFSRAEVL